MLLFLGSVLLVFAGIQSDGDVAHLSPMTVSTMGCP
jgi:hypothetical protein